MAVTYQILENPQNGIAAYQPYGAAADLWMYKGHECILSGPAETGKTLAALHKLDALCWKYAGAQCAIVRKTYKSIPGSVLQTYEHKVLGAWNKEANNGQGGFDQSKTPVKKYGGEKPEWYDYPNGSRIWVGGMDNPDKVLSSERDFVYINQTEELTIDDYEKLLTRCTGRAGNSPYAQLFGDCNPSHRKHWILERRDSGKLKLLESRHEDNPTLFNQDTGAITEQGKITLAVLDGLTGVRYYRLRKGLWVSAEGMIYEEFDPAIHVIDPFPIPDHWRRYRAVDFGFVNPFVCGWAAVDEDKRIYLYRQIYHTGRTVKTHSDKIKLLSAGERIETTICDHDAEDRATLAENGIPNMAAKKAISTGIERVKERLKVQADGRPRLFVFRDSVVEVDESLRVAHKPTSTEDEFEVYIWSDKTKKETPVDENNHGLDMIRYLTAHIDERKTSSILIPGKDF